MKLRVLGCSGGVGGHLHTTSFLLGERTLIDAGTGAGTLSFDELKQIDRIFVTHSHLDHIAMIPLIVDTVGPYRHQPITLCGTEEVLRIIRRNIFNWEIWPDFATIPNHQSPLLRYCTIGLGEAVDVGGAVVRALPAEHSVPAVGYHIDSGEGSLVFSGDTTVCPPFWQAVNAIDNLRHVIVETAFSDREHQLADLSKHMCPARLAEALAYLEKPADIFITHLKPGDREMIAEEIDQQVSAYSLQLLVEGQIIEF